MAGWQVDRHVISKIERGDRQVSDIEAEVIAQALGVSVSSLFGEVDQTESKASRRDYNLRL
jgi:transcriptional regulator with XRE-family HTH domain